MSVYFMVNKSTSSWIYAIVIKTHQRNQAADLLHQERVSSILDSEVVLELKQFKGQINYEVDKHLNSRIIKDKSYVYIYLIKSYKRIPFLSQNLLIL